MLLAIAWWKASKVVRSAPVTDTPSSSFGTPGRGLSRTGAIQVEHGGGAVAGQTTTTNAPARTSGFVLPHKTKDGRLVRFTGADKQILSPITFRIFGFRVETFNSDGTPNLTGEAPECVLDISTKSISSSGLLTVSQAGGTFTLTGEGFSWNQESERLQLSNRVHAVFKLNAPRGALMPPK
jgi:hypothetical protein